jgi:transposase
MRGAKSETFINHHSQTMKEPDHTTAGSRQPKQALLPQITKLAEEGLSSHQIATKLGRSPSTIARWQREMRDKSYSQEPPDPTERIARKIKRYRSIYRKLIAAWRRSQGDKEVRLVEDTAPAGEPAAGKKKRSLRTETQTGNAAYLAKALDVQRRIDQLEDRLAGLHDTETETCGDGRSPLADLTDEDLERFTNDDLDTLTDDELDTVSARLRAKYEREGAKNLRPSVTSEELRAMTDEQLDALANELREEIARGEQAATSDV